MEYLSRLSSLVAPPARQSGTGNNTLNVPKRRKPSNAPRVGSLDLFHKDWQAIYTTLNSPDERALFFGIDRTGVPQLLQRLVDALVFESSRSHDGSTGPCMEYLLKHDILNQLVNLCHDDKPSGIQAHVIQTFANLIVLLDEKFLSRQAVHQPISDLIELCISSDYGQDDFDNDHRPTAPTDRDRSDYHADLVELMCQIATRIRSTPELLLIFFSDDRVDSDRANYARDSDADLSVGSVYVPSDDGDQKPTIQVRPPSPAESIDSTATLQPNKAGQSHANTEASSSLSGRQRQRRLRFPLFSYLLRFIHREGRIGELARAGLLFLITPDVRSTQPGSGKPASQPKIRRVTFVEQPLEQLRNALATFVANSDFADVLGAGLGAAYGLLPGRIRISRTTDPAASAFQGPELEGTGSAITMGSGHGESDETDHLPQDALTAIASSDSPELQTQLRLLVDLLDFAQDVIESIGVYSRHFEDNDARFHMVEQLVLSVCKAVRDTFIKNVIYPSLMESSDTDGSATAVTSYLDVILLALREGHLLTEVILQFLLGFEAQGSAQLLATISAAARSGSSDAGSDARSGINLSDDGMDRYNMRDLIMDNMAFGKRTPAKVAAMKLAKTLIICHGRHAMGGLIRVERGPSAAQVETGEETCDDGANVWGEAVSAARAASEKRGLGFDELRVSQHVKELDCYATLLSLLSDTPGLETMHTGLSQYLVDAEQAIRHDSTFELAMRPALGGTEAYRDWEQTQLSPSDPFIQLVFELLAQLFRNPPEENLALTGIVSALALSPLRSLQGWLTYGHGAADEEPAVLGLLTGLARQVQSYRKTVPDFDRYLAERRRGLLLADDLSEALYLDETGFGEKEAEGGEKKRLMASLSLPRARKQKPDASDADPSLRVVEDRRSEVQAKLVAAAAAAAAAAATSATATETAKSGSGSALARLFGGRPVKAAKAAAEETQAAAAAAAAAVGGAERNVEASPYALHYEETTHVWVQAVTVDGAEAWRRAVEWTATERAGEARTSKVTLSSVLDNTILLCELVKELVAIMAVRRGWGMDRVSF